METKHTFNELSTSGLVSILLPIHNASRNLRLALESLLNQTYRNIEVIAVDDGSKDESIEILKTFAEKDSRIKIFKNKKRYGLSTCLNRGFRYAKGQFIAFMDANDISFVQRVEKQVEFLTQNPKVAVVGTQCEFVDPETRSVAKSSFPLDHEEVKPALFAGVSIQPETAMINRHVLPKDALKFEGTSYRFLPKERRVIYTKAFMNLVSYGQIENLSDFLYRHRYPGTIKSVVGIVKLWINSFIQPNDYRPSFRTLLLPFNNQTRLVSQ